MGDERMAKIVYESDVRGVRRRGRPRKCWMDGLKEVLARKGLNIHEAEVSIQDRNIFATRNQRVKRATGILKILKSIFYICYFCIQMFSTAYPKHSQERRKKKQFLLLF